MQMNEEQKWEIAKNVAKYLVEKRSFGPASLLTSMRDNAMLAGVMNQLGYDGKIGVYEIMGHVNTSILMYHIDLEKKVKA